MVEEKRKAKCPRCRKEANIDGFKQNPNIDQINMICWKCYRQLLYYFKNKK